MERNVPGSGSALLLFAATLVLNTVINVALFNLSPDLGMLIGEPLAILLPTLAVLKFSRLDARTTLRLRRPQPLDLLMALPLAASLAVLNDQLSNLTGLVFPMPPEVQREITDLLRADSGYDWAVRLVGIGLGAALSEEVLFRGFIQSGLERSLGRTGAILLASGLFALMHLLPWGMPSYVLAGLVLGLTAVATASLAVPVLIHLTNNVAAVVLLNLGGVETLGRPVWIPAEVLLPALAVFALAVSYYLRRAARLPPAAEPVVSLASPEMAALSPGRRKLGWMVVGCGVGCGTMVVLGLFGFSLLYSPRVMQQAMDQQVREMKEELLRSLPAGASQRQALEIEQEFDSLLGLNEAGRLSITSFARLLWLQLETRADGSITEAEIDRLLEEIRLILRSAVRVRRL